VRDPGMAGAEPICAGSKVARRGWSLVVGVLLLVVTTCAPVVAHAGPAAAPPSQTGSAPGRGTGNSATAKITYACLAGTTFGLCAINGDGTGLTLLVTAASWVYGGELSPDGGKVTYWAGPTDDSQHIWVANADGSHPVDLGPGGESSWSPDGGRLVYTSDAHSGGVWSINVDGTGAARQISPVGRGGRWSPDGRRIMFVVNPGNSTPPGIYTVPLEGGAPTMLIPGTTSAIPLTDAAWSPDGSRIAFTSGPGHSPETGGPGVQVANADGSGARTLDNLDPRSGHYDWSPSWAPDGASVLVQRSQDQGNYAQFIAVNVDSPGERLVLNPAPGHGPRWGGASSAPRSAPCRYTTRSAPAVVVVLVMGLNSELPDAPAYDVRSVDYCHIASSPNPQLSTVGATFDSIGPGSGSTTLARSIGEQGAVILPFSYRGAGFVDHDMFKAAGYDKQTPNASDVIADATLLDNELVSIRDQWPSTHIVIIGHSLGGLTAKQWWRNWDGHQAGAEDHARRSWNISAVFSLDGPINGGPTENAQWTPDGNCPTGGPLKMLPCGRLAMQFAALWDDYAMRGDDTTMAQTDSGDRGIYTPIGTTGDVVMEALRGPVGINDNGEELGVQLFAQFNTDGTVNTLLQPGALSGQGAHFWQRLDSHGVVYRDPTNIALITQAVRQAAADTGSPQPSGPSSYDSLTRPSPPAPQAALAQPVAHNGLIVVRGAHLGTSPGELGILSATSTRDCSVTTWSDTAITCRTNPNGQSGYVVGQTATGLPIFAGAVLLPPPAPSGTTVQIHAPRSGRTPAGGAQPVQLSVTGNNGPAAATSVTAVLGDTPITLTTGPDGTVTVPVTGEGHAHVQAAVGTNTATAELSWQPDPVTLMTASPPITANPGSASTVTITATDSTGKPVTGIALQCGITGPAAPSGRSTPCTTDTAGTVHITLRGNAGQQAVAWAATQDGRSDAATTLSWQHPARRHTQTTAIAIAIALVCGAAIVLLLLLLKRRRRNRNTSQSMTFPS
jgi:TolB protein